MLDMEIAQLNQPINFNKSLNFIIMSENITCWDRGHALFPQETKFMILF